MRALAVLPDYSGLQPGFSSLTGLLRTTAYVRKFIERVKAKVKGTTEPVSPELNVLPLSCIAGGTIRFQN